MSYRVDDIAETWPQSVRIPRVKNPTRAHVDSFIRSGEPALFEGIVPEAYQKKGSLQYLAEHFGDQELRAFLDFPEKCFGAMPPERTMTVAEFVEWIKSPERELPCQAVNFPLELLEPERGFGFQDLHPEVEADQLWLQSEGTAIGLHVHQQVWVGGVDGRKDVVLIHRKYTSKAFEPLSLNPNHVKLDPRYPDFERHPELREVVPFYGTITPGDVLFIPSFMWHFLWSLEPAVTAHSDFTNPVRVPGDESFEWPEFTRSIGKWYGQGMNLELARQALWYGALKRPIPERQHAYESPPWGVFIWRALTGG